MSHSGKGPNYQFIDQRDLDSIHWAMTELKLLGAGGIGEVSKAGEGNMNVVLRVVVEDRSVILKQSRPWVERYPSIEAPEQRILAEIDFYRRVTAAHTEFEFNAANWMPQVLGSSAAHRLLAIEDLGAASDYTTLYETQSSIPENDQSVFADTTRWLAHLHHLQIHPTDHVGCEELRRLNHEHMYVIPLLETPAIDLNAICDGLMHASIPIRTDEAVRNAMNRLGKDYLEGNCRNGQTASLLHGDFYPGSWLRTDAGLRVIDPEFCFAGPPEFDLGVMLAHQMMCQQDPNANLLKRVCDEYRSYGGQNVDRRYVGRFAGAEIIRRILGVAQLPQSANLETRVCWLALGRQLLIGNE